MGWEVKIDMSGQSKDCLWVCNVKMKNFLPGQKRGTFPRNFGFQGHSIERFEHFFMEFGVPISLTVADISWPISARSRCATEPCFEFVPRSKRNRKRKRKRNQHPKSINISLNIGHPRLVFSQNT